MTDPVPGVALFTLGCRLNQYESDGILNQFTNSGRYRRATLEEGPEIAIINTCTVTDRADAGNRALIRKIRARSPGATIVVTGCFAQTDPDAASSIEGVDFVIGNDRKADLFRFVDLHLRGDAAVADPKEKTSVDHLSDPFGYGHVTPQGHVRAYLKIQDGCDRRCTYCKIPSARGPGISRGSKEIIEEALRLEQEGYREIVLTGVNIGWFRDRAEGLRLNGLLERLLALLSSSRIRLSSLEPCDLDDHLADLTTHPNFCDFLHVPLQSGSRAILRRMRRSYTPDTFRLRINKVRKSNPGIFLGTDVMVGFPGETDRDFEETVRLCSDLGFAKLHIFPFSPRRGTAAAEYSGRVDGAIVRERIRELEGLNDRNWHAYAERALRSTRVAIVENPRSATARFRGRALTDNFLPLSFDDSAVSIRPGDMVRFRLMEILEAGRILAEPI